MPDRLLRDFAFWNHGSIMSVLTAKRSFLRLVSSAHIMGMDRSGI